MQVGNFPETLTWVEPQSTRERVTFLASAKLFFYTFRIAFLVSVAVALLVGFAIGNILYAIKSVTLEHFTIG